MSNQSTYCLRCGWVLETVFCLLFQTAPFENPQGIPMDSVLAPACTRAGSTSSAVEAGTLNEAAASCRITLVLAPTCTGSSTSLAVKAGSWNEGATSSRTNLVLAPACRGVALVLIMTGTQKDAHKWLKHYARLISNKCWITQISEKVRCAALEACFPNLPNFLFVSQHMNWNCHGPVS
jgi:hypothetical protein